MKASEMVDVETAIAKVHEGAARVLRALKPYPPRLRESILERAAEETTLEARLRQFPELRQAGAIRPHGVERGLDPLAALLAPGKPRRVSGRSARGK